MDFKKKVCLLFTLCCFILFLWQDCELKRYLKDEEYGTESRWTDITDVVVPRGNKYNEHDGVIYHCLSGSVHRKVGRIYTMRPFRTVTNDKSMGSEINRKREGKFQEIFDTQMWIANEYKESETNKMSPEFFASGPGSTLDRVQRPLLLLNALIERLKVKLNTSVITMVDIPCGDFIWMRKLIGQREDVQYTGIDIVPTLIEKHRINYRHMKNAKFEHLDIVKSRLNLPYDIIFCREMLQHLVDEDVMQVLDHFSSSGSKLLVTTLYELNTPNVKIETGGFRNLNLMLPPFNLQPPMCLIKEEPEDWVNKRVAVWKLPLKQIR